ncbi:doublecortin domain-containing protein 2C isoform X3 [Lissotriton helveticus]
MRAFSVDETPFTTSYCYLPPETPGIHHYYRQHSSQLTPAKTVFVHRNGDPFFVGRKFVVNKRHIPTFEHFLVEVTRRVPLDLGAAQRIYTPRHGSRVRKLEELKQGQRVVAAGKECFKKIDYLQISPRKFQAKKEEVIKPVVHSGIVVSSKWANYVRDSCTINVFKNGDILVPPLRMLISKHTLKDWDHVLAAIAVKVHPSIGSVQRLCTIDGQRVCLGDIKNNQYYVAVGKEKFKRLPYSQWLPKGCRVEAQRTLTNKQGDRKKNEQLDKFSSRRHEDGQCDMYFKQMYQDPSFTSKEEKYAFHINSKDLKHSKELPPIMPKPERGIFRAYSGREEFRGAAEVPEDKRMKVELPIDQVPANVIHEEDIPVQSEEETLCPMYNEEKTVHGGQASHNLLHLKEERGANEDFDKIKYSKVKVQSEMLYEDDRRTTTYDQRTDSTSSSMNMNEGKIQYAKVETKSEEKKQAQHTMIDLSLDKYGKISALGTKQKVASGKNNWKIRTKENMPASCHRTASKIPKYQEKSNSDKPSVLCGDHKKKFIEEVTKAKEGNQADRARKNLCQFTSTKKILKDQNKKKTPPYFHHRACEIPKYQQNNSSDKPSKLWADDKIKFTKAKEENQTDTARKDLSQFTCTNKVLKIQPKDIDKENVPLNFQRDADETDSYHEPVSSAKSLVHWADKKIKSIERNTELEEETQTDKAKVDHSQDVSANKKLKVESSDILLRRGLQRVSYEEVTQESVIVEPRDGLRQDHLKALQKEKVAFDFHEWAYVTPKDDVQPRAIHKESSITNVQGGACVASTYDEISDTDESFTQRSGYSMMHLEEKIKPEVEEQTRKAQVHTRAIHEESSVRNIKKGTDVTPTYDEICGTDKPLAEQRDYSMTYLQGITKPDIDEQTGKAQVHTRASHVESSVRNVQKGPYVTPTYDEICNTDTPLAQQRDYSMTYLQGITKTDVEKQTGKAQVHTRASHVESSVRNVQKGPYVTPTYDEMCNTDTPLAQQRDYSMTFLQGITKPDVDEQTGKAQVHTRASHVESSVRNVQKGPYVTPTYDEICNTDTPLAQQRDYSMTYLQGITKTDVEKQTGKAQVHTRASHVESSVRNVQKGPYVTPTYDEMCNTDTPLAQQRDYSMTFLQGITKPDVDEQTEKAQVHTRASHAESSVRNVQKGPYVTPTYDEMCNTDTPITKPHVDEQTEKAQVHTRASHVESSVRNVQKGPYVTPTYDEMFNTDTPLAQERDYSMTYLQGITKTDVDEQNGKAQVHTRASHVESSVRNVQKGPYVTPTYDEMCNTDTPLAQERDYSMTYLEGITKTDVDEQTGKAQVHTRASHVESSVRNVQKGLYVTPTYDEMCNTDTPLAQQRDYSMTYLQGITKPDVDEQTGKAQDPKDHSTRKYDGKHEPLKSCKEFIQYGRQLKDEVNGKNVEAKADKVQPKAIHRENVFIECHDGTCVTPTYDEIRGTNKSVACRKDYDIDYIEESPKSEIEDKSEKRKVDLSLVKYGTIPGLGKKQSSTSVNQIRKVQTTAIHQEKVPVKFQEGVCRTPSHDESRDANNSLADSKMKYRDEKPKSEHEKQRNKEKLDLSLATYGEISGLGKKQRIPHVNKIRKVAAENLSRACSADRRQHTSPYLGRSDMETAFSKWKNFEEEYMRLKRKSGLLGKKDKFAAHVRPVKPIPVRCEEKSHAISLHDERRDTEKAFAKWKMYEEECMNRKANSGSLGQADQIPVKKGSKRKSHGIQEHEEIHEPLKSFKDFIHYGEQLKKEVNGKRFDASTDKVPRKKATRRKKPNNKQDEMQNPLKSVDDNIQCRVQLKNEVIGKKGASKVEKAGEHRK